LAAKAAKMIPAAQPNTKYGTMVFDVWRNNTGVGDGEPPKLAEDENAMEAINVTPINFDFPITLSPIDCPYAT
jgi:hypothetical protein